MIKGTRKKIFMIKCDRKSPFEAAIFILKPEKSGDGSVAEDDVVERACELIRSASAGSGRG